MGAAGGHRGSVGHYGPMLWGAGAADGRREQLSEERVRVRQKNEVLLVRSVGAAIALGEATATALKNGHANGETEAALAYARQVKHEQKDFLTEQGIRAIYDKEEGSSWTRF